NIGHVAGHPHVRDAAVFVGAEADLVPARFGPGPPAIRDWVPRHFDFSGYVLPFDPADYADTARLRRSPSFDPAQPLVDGWGGGARARRAQLVELPGPDPAEASSCPHAARAFTTGRTSRPSEVNS